MRTRLGLLLILVVPGLAFARQNSGQSTSQSGSTAPAKKEAPAAKPAAKQEAAPAQAAQQEQLPGPERPTSVAPAPHKSPGLPAPKPGHPLDPADVDVLTGKNRQPSYSYGGVLIDHYGYYYGSRFTTPGGYGSLLTTPGGHGTGQYISPLAIGRANGQNFVVVGGQVGNTPFLTTFGAGSNFIVLFRSGFLFY